MTLVFIITSSKKAETSFISGDRHIKGELSQNTRVTGTERSNHTAWRCGRLSENHCM